MHAFAPAGIFLSIDPAVRKTVQLYTTTRSKNESSKEDFEGIKVYRIVNNP